MSALVLAATGCGATEDGGGGSGDGAAERRAAAPCGEGTVANPVTLVYEAVPTPSVPRVTPAAVDRTASVVCERLAAMEAPSYRVRAAGGDRIRIDLGEGPAAERALERVGSSDRLHVYDWEPNVLGGQGPDVPYAGRGALYDAVTAAATLAPRAEASDLPPGGAAPEVERRLGGDERAIRRHYDRANDSHLGRCYLFDGDEQLVAGPEANCSDLHEAAADAPAGARLFAVPRGVVVVEATRAPNQPEDVHSYFVVEDDSELSGSDIENPEQNIDRHTNEPIVTMELTDDGRRAFAVMTKRIAERGAAAIVAPGTDPALLMQRFALVLDDGIVSLATIDFRENPDGIDGRTGAQINGVGDLQETRDLAESLRIGAPPLDLKLVEQR